MKTIKATRVTKTKKVTAAMKVLGIESTCHTFSIAIVEKRNGKFTVLANEVAKYPSTCEGYIPWKLADHHAVVFQQLLSDALAKSHISLSEISAVAYSQGSGIGHCLHVGFVAAKTLSKTLAVPLVPVNHSVAHIEIGRAFNCATTDPLIVYVSGGNTQILALDVNNKKEKHYRVYGETIDIGIGNFLDVLGRDLQLKPPDAAGVAHSAGKGKKFIELPYTVRGMNLAFSGLQTYISKKVLPQIKLGKLSAEDVCYSVQETAFAMLCEAVERALCHTGKKELLLCGGNARNQRLQEMLREVCHEHDVNFACTSFEYSGDQAAMIALTGIKMLESKSVPRDVTPRQRMRTDSTRIMW
ncbi:MAG: tRNA (adenosine(37)-N6)-threonylcarbamoyltransferase complex transferase subunit TsaD [Candidatus Micrarchaeota archaeon]